MAKMSDELAAAGEAYDRARCRAYWAEHVPGATVHYRTADEHYRDARMSDANRQYIAPMIKAAVDAYLGAMRPPSGPPPAAIFVRFGEFESHITLRSWNVEAFPGALEYRRV